MSAADQADAVEIQVLRGAATEEELAALIAVLSEAYVTEESEVVAVERRASAWSRTQRGLRTPLRRDIPWGRFSG